MSWERETGWAHVDLSTELFNGLHRARCDDDLTTTDLLALDATEEGTHVVTGFGLGRQISAIRIAKGDDSLTLSSSLWNISS